MRQPALLILVLVLVLFALPVHSADPVPELRWEALLPKGWNPAGEFKGIDFSKLADADPRAADALETLRRVWDNAPTEPSLDGKRVRIAGFALPLDPRGNKVTEFLIVPYFGACIHAPPPPANQIIHAVSARPLDGVRTMVPLWAYGTLQVKRRETSWGVSGYRLMIEKIMPYEAPAKP